MTALIACTVWIAGLCADGPNRIHDVHIIGNEITCPVGERLLATLDPHSGAIEIWCAPAGKEVKP
jgi:hypothetical protein